MKKIGIATVVIAAMILSGCSQANNISVGGSQPNESLQSSDSSQSIGSSQSSGSSSGTETSKPNSSSSGGAPNLVAPDFSDIVSEAYSENTPDSPYENIPDSPSENTPDSPEVSEQTSLNHAEEPLIGDVVSNGESKVISQGEEIRIQSGNALDIQGMLRVENGGKITVENGGVLRVSGDVELSGDIELLGGRLVMSDSGAYIQGGGNVIVTEDFDSIDCEVGTIKAHITPPARKVIDGVTTVGGIVIANKSIKLPPEFGSHLSLDEVEPEVYSALAEMNEYSDHQYLNRSGYRSYWDQKAIFQNYCDMYGYEEANTFSSQAGHSEHQTGLTMDLDAFEESYGTTPEGIWLAENCYKFGFIIRYPKGKEHITGYTYEPWHVRYIGKSTAKLVYDSGLSLEEFFNVEGGTTVID